jgi:hypothetical protein
MRAACTYSSITIMACIVLFTGCQQAPPPDRDPMTITLHFVWAVSMSPGNPMGGTVTDHFVIKARVREPGIQRVKPGDTFRAALNIGTTGKPAKYGGISGLKFTITSRPEISTYYPASGTTHVTWYWAEADPVAITCNNENKLRFTVDGDGVDNIVIRVKTAGMPAPFESWQNGQPSPIFPDHNPLAKQILKYTCLLKGSSVMIE